MYIISNQALATRLTQNELRQSTIVQLMQALILLSYHFNPSLLCSPLKPTRGKILFIESYKTSAVPSTFPANPDLARSRQASKASSRRQSEVAHVDVPGLLQLVSQINQATQKVR